MSKVEKAGNINLNNDLKIQVSHQNAILISFPDVGKSNLMNRTSILVIVFSPKNVREASHLYRVLAGNC